MKKNTELPLHAPVGIQALLKDRSMFPNQLVLHMEVIRAALTTTDPNDSSDGHFATCSAVSFKRQCLGLKM